MSAQWRHDTRPSVCLLHTLPLHCVTLILTFDFLTENWHTDYSFRGKSSHQLFFFYVFFCFRARTRQTDRQTGRRTIGRDPQCGLLGQLHSKQTDIDRQRAWVRHLPAMHNHRTVGLVNQRIRWFKDYVVELDEGSTRFRDSLVRPGRVVIMSNCALRLFRLQHSDGRDSIQVFHTDNVQK